MDKKRVAPRLTDSLLIILITAALAIFVLWATSRLMGLNLFENLSPWLERSLLARTAAPQVRRRCASRYV
jgi:hypothetical protein